MNPSLLFLGAALLVPRLVGSPPPRDTVVVSDNHRESVSQLFAALSARTDTKITRLADGGMEVKDEQKGWVFVPPQYPAYPAVVEYHLIFGKGKHGLTLGTQVQCDVKGSSCDDLVQIVESNVAAENQQGHEFISYVGYSPLYDAGKNCPTAKQVSYPKTALAQAAQGTVLLLVNVGINGPKQYLIERSSRNEYLDDAAITAVKSWCFRRPESVDVAAEYWVSVPVQFRLPQ